MSDTARPAATGVLSTAEIRSHFPALRREHGGRPVAYFDGPGGTQVPREVVEAVSDYLYHHNANTHWAYPTSAETDEIIERSRQTLADFLGASHEEIVFGANATTLAYHVSRKNFSDCPERAEYNSRGQARSAPPPVGVVKMRRPRRGRTTRRVRRPLRGRNNVLLLPGAALSPLASRLAARACPRLLSSSPPGIRRDKPYSFRLAGTLGEKR